MFYFFFYRRGWLTELDYAKDMKSTWRSSKEYEMEYAEDMPSNKIIT